MLKKVFKNRSNFFKKTVANYHFFSIPSSSHSFQNINHNYQNLSQLNDIRDPINILNNEINYDITSFNNIKIIDINEKINDMIIIEEDGEEEKEQIECLKRTYQPKTLRKKRKHGFLSRVKSRNGRKVLERRVRKGRHSLTV
eukprot:TRINITY_DN4990_c0_g2_i1.p1 TRINITY_DN4990_c0_g2~~TRINITY_DN4990_c0_g2_i1.p1  ORF type:complete len:142 (+),score=43.01 TRINITY_DN4990_c0_g2_i1:1-426(+)